MASPETDPVAEPLDLDQIDPDVPKPSEWPAEMKGLLDELETLQRAKVLMSGSSVTDSGADYQVGQDLMVNLEHALKGEFASRLIRTTRLRTKEITGHDWDPYPNA
jgi:hypothetical protein